MISICLVAIFSTSAHVEGVHQSISIQKYKNTKSSNGAFFAILSTSNTHFEFIIFLFVHSCDKISWFQVILQNKAYESSKNYHFP